ncbi:DUF6361 family protein [Halomonas daqiaonensis]|uniref:Uncharacterized protein n=1 Tax=Halomonas daqiaonensis TaxID=650850 RepID=A0A1H7NZY9_9GAMM|nr:DUF6361 family protein [Halomonas daqiaonensis]SEL28946.1 hypothetical protein SAMN04488129_108144 [Halomonas daqiaonensis]
MSSLAWIDFDEAERQRAQRIIALFQERESRDELGLGSIRDSIADHLFPGTSTIQTRLRYMLFVPWLYQSLEQRRRAPHQLKEEARTLEIRLVEALKTGGEKKGIIGREAGVKLQRLPSSVYWAGLNAWGIRLFHGSIDSYFAALQRRRLDHTPDESETSAERYSNQKFWTKGLPPCPAKLLDSTTFRLTKDEAGFIIDRLVSQQPSSLLTHLAQHRVDAECDYIWEHPQRHDFPAKAQHLVQQADRFSAVLHGASLLYNLQLSERREHDDWVRSYQQRIEAWADGIDLKAIQNWSLDDFWKTVEHPAHNIRPATRRFVAQWLEQVASGVERISASYSARSLVKKRESQLKSSQSRFTNRAVLDRWTGASGAERLSFRWSQAKSHLRDLAHAR